MQQQAYPVAQAQVVTAQPMAQAQPIGVQQVKVQTVGYQQQQQIVQPGVAVVMVGGQQPPPGAPPGGVWRQMNYCGPITWLIGIFFFWCIVCCPVDTRLEYVVGGVRYGPAGEILGDC